MSPLTITIIILVLTIVAFMSGRVSFSLISMGIILSLILTKIDTPAQALSGFVNQNVAMFVAMFVIGAGLTKTSILDRTQSLVLRYRDNPKMLIFIASFVAALLAVLTSATAAAAIMLPLIIGIANEIDFSRSKILFPAMVVANIVTGMTFLGQGASNMAFSDIMMQSGGIEPFTIWSFTIARLPFFLIALVYVSFIGWRLLPDIPNDQFQDNFKKKESVKLSPAKEKTAISLIVLTIGAMLFAKELHMSLFVISALGACSLVFFGILDEKEALSSIHLPTVFLFAGVLPLSAAVKSTGAGEVVADLMIQMLGNSTNPYFIMSVFFIVPLIMTQLMSNLATMTIFIPLVSAAGVKIGVDPRALVMGVLIAGSTSILTPMAAPAQAIIMGPGGYQLKHYLKAALPLVVVITVFSIFFLPVLFPFK
ncbi:SLC13 family permease [Vibrio quintilis]|uniref:Sodium:sulfate symporter transmembrane region n=1 Tax=Vibrio quintilis TaxID=1117707 RepID=A0A1M7Z2R1_9VIBR|nr:SLC13 family permease [Vibrio quintilis]SHO59183.1 Sodium:sulfate symporter transmembrane region [Vibrio quintilis]